jgi:hypothetical protein
MTTNFFLGHGSLAQDMFDGKKKELKDLMNYNFKTVDHTHY